MSINNFQSALGPLHVNLVSYNNVGLNTLRYDNGLTSGFGWPGVNRAIYYPVYLPFYWTARRMWVITGTGTATNNLDLGMYDASGNLRVSTGAVARGGPSTCTYYDVTDFSGHPGLWYVGMVYATTTSNAFIGPPLTASRLKMAGCLQEDVGSTTLPSSMTPSTITGLGRYFTAGFTQSSTL